MDFAISPARAKLILKVFTTRWGVIFLTLIRLSSLEKVQPTEDKSIDRAFSVGRGRSKLNDTLSPIPSCQVMLRVDNFSLQKKSLSFKLHYIRSSDILPLIKPLLSPKGKISLKDDKIDVEDAAYPLSLIKDKIKKEDVFHPVKKTFKLKYASASTLSTRIEDLLSDKGKVSFDEKENTISVVDAKKFLDRVSSFIKNEDRIENQLITRVYHLLYLSPLEAKIILQNKISKYGRIDIFPLKKEKEKQKQENEIIEIPQEKSKNPVNKVKKEKSEKSEKSTGNFSFSNTSIICITDLKRDFPEIEKLIEELNSSEWASKDVTQTFYIKEGSVEKIALTIASMLGVSPDKIKGLKLKKGSWMQMQITSPTIDLGNIGAVGKKP